MTAAERERVDDVDYAAFEEESRILRFSLPRRPDDLISFFVAREQLRGIPLSKRLTSTLTGPATLHRAVHVQPPCGGCPVQSEAIDVRKRPCVIL